MNKKIPPSHLLFIAINIAFLMPAWADDPGDWHHATPGLMHHITVADLPPPYSTSSTGNSPTVIKKPANASLSVLPGFTVKLFAKGLQNPRIIRVAPNGDIFVAETRMNRAITGSHLDFREVDKILSTSRKSRCDPARFPVDVPTTDSGGRPTTHYQKHFSMRKN